MTEERMECLLARLERRLGLADADEDTLTVLMDELTDAENELKLYLNVSELPETLFSKVEELAEVFYRRDISGKGGDRSSFSYSEGQITQSEGYFSPREYRAAVSEVLDSVARYRRVSC